MTGISQKGAGWYLHNSSFYPRDKDSPLLKELFGEHSHGHKYQVCFFPHTERCVYIPLPPLPIFLIIFRVPDGPVKPLTTAHEYRFPISGHVFQAK